MDVALLDSRDSFTFNLAQAFAELGASVHVVEAGRVGADHVRSLRPRLVCIGPGPRGPSDMPALVETCRALHGEIPLFGVCLGMQALALAHGGAVERSAITLAGGTLFEGLPSPLYVMRYHSLVVTRVPSGFRVCARDEEGQPMAMESDDGHALAVQFHPESIGTSGGLHVLARALARAGIEPVAPRYRRGSIPPPDVGGRKVPHATSYAAS